MCYVIFYRDWPRPGATGACGMTTWTRHAFDRKTDPAWEIEAHDSWPEARTHINLLQLVPIKPLPEHVAKMGVQEFMATHYNLHN